MPKYTITAELVISVSTDVEAPNLNRALQKAMGRDIVRLCQQCADGEPDKEWVTSGELDGLPSAPMSVLKDGEPIQDLEKAIEYWEKAL